MLTWTLVLLAMVAGGLVGLIGGFVLTAIEIRIQCGGLNSQELNEMHVDCPGERLPAVSFLFGTVNTALSRTLMYVAGTWVFIARGEHPSILPMAAFALFCLPNDANRIKKFSGSTGQPTEIGYSAGGIVAFGLFLWLRTKMM